jgi:hypothetical protein
MAIGCPAIERGALIHRGIFLGIDISSPDGVYRCRCSRFRELATGVGFNRFNQL